MSDVILEIKGLTKTFNMGSVNQKTVLNGLNLQINRGDFITVIGGNGAGKSTLMNAITGVFTCEAGEIKLNGEDITWLPEHKRAKYFGRVFQDPMLGTAPNMEIEENLALAYRRGKRRGLGWGVTKPEREIYREELAMLELGLEDRMSSKVGLLSGGQRQALTLLMATLVQPEMLLLDEHTAALDPKTAKNVLDLTEKIVTENNLTTLMVTHNMRDAIRYGNRLIMLDHGEIIFDISGEEKAALTVEALLEKFNTVSKGGVMSDRAILG